MTLVVYTCEVIVFNAVEVSVVKYELVSVVTLVTGIVEVTSEVRTVVEGITVVSRSVTVLVVPRVEVTS
jgi:hypothetical protein